MKIINAAPIGMCVPAPMPKPIPQKPFSVRCKKSRAHSTCARGWSFKQYNYYAIPTDAESFLKKHPEAEPVEHKRYGIGWKINVDGKRCYKCKRWIEENDHCRVYFFDQPDLMVQEIMVHQQREKLLALGGDSYEI